MVIVDKHVTASDVSQEVTNCDNLQKSVLSPPVTTTSSFASLHDIFHSWIFS